MSTEEEENAKLVDFWKGIEVGPKWAQYADYITNFEQNEKCNFSFGRWKQRFRKQNIKIVLRKDNHFTIGPVSSEIFQFAHWQR